MMVPIWDWGMFAPASIACRSCAIRERCALGGNGRVGITRAVFDGDLENMAQDAYRMVMGEELFLLALVVLHSKHSALVILLTSLVASPVHAFSKALARNS